ncbi:MAG TPA: hypothetical protein VFU21_16295 [Kofleriaceae bacterium]|nr:hypothetical protein [Kofleriaceae bacterium]
MAAAPVAVSLSPAPAEAGTRARPSRKGKVAAARSVKALATRQRENDALISSLGAKKERAEKQAAAEVASWSDDKMARTGWRPGQREKATKERTKQLFGRTERRILEAAEIVKGLLEKEAMALSEIERGQLRAKQIEISRSAQNNKKMGLERQAFKKLRRIMHKRLPRVSHALGKVIPWLRRDTQIDPNLLAGNLAAGDGPTDALDPEDSTMWKPRKQERIAAYELNVGPWLKPDKRPTMPDADTVLELDGFRNMDADGTHPSVFVQDPVTDTEWKVKFQGEGKVNGNKYLTPDPVVSRLLYAMGYHTSVVYNGGRLKMDPRAVLAAFEHKPRVGIRVRKDKKIGFSQYRMRNFIDRVELTDGTVLEGMRGYTHLARARKDPRVLDTIKYVQVKEVDLALKEGGDTSIGPFNPDDAPHVDRREMRALSVIQQSWLLGRDIKPSNVRLDVDTEDGGVELVHRLSDAGAALATVDPNAIGWEVDIDTAGKWLHTDINGYTLRALDRTRMDDARWAVRQIAKLSEEQIMASVASGATSWPVVVLYTEKLVARRDSLVKRFGLEGELGLLRTRGPNKRISASGEGSFEVLDGKGVKQTIKVPAGNYNLVRGRLVEK